jgi:hypothetical protein
MFNPNGKMMIIGLRGDTKVSQQTHGDFVGGF